MATIDQIPRTWGCTPTCERTVALLFSSAVSLLQPFVPAALVDPIFVAFAPTWAETRRQAWEACWDCPRVSIIVDDEEIEGYLTDRLWMLELAVCVAGGGCGIAAPPCLQVNFYNHP